MRHRHEPGTLRRPPRGPLLLALLVALVQAGVVVGPVCAAPEEPASPIESGWLLTTLQDSHAVAPGEVLRFHHTGGDVRIKVGETDRVEVTALAQHHADDPRRPAIRFAPVEVDQGTDQGASQVEQPGLHHRGLVLIVDFAHMEVEEQEAWAKRRIDVGLYVPKGTAFEIETVDGLIEAKGISAPAKLKADHGEIVYKGQGDLTAHSERGEMRVVMQRTGPGHTVDLSTLTGDIWLSLLEGAHGQVEVETRGPITTDYSIAIDRQAGSPLKKGRIRIGSETGPETGPEGGGSRIHLESHSGGIRLQGLIVAEDRKP